MRALVLERVNELSIWDIEIDEKMGPDDVRIAVKKVDVCGSDVHFYRHGSIGHFVVRKPLVLGHEASG
jgi:D-xylulose reductase